MKSHIKTFELEDFSCTAYAIAYVDPITKKIIIDDTNIDEYFLGKTCVDIVDLPLPILVDLQYQVDQCEEWDFEREEL